MPALSRSVAEAVRPLLGSNGFAQLVRFAVAGLGVTLFAAAIYLVATACHVPPFVANTMGTLCGVGVGYLVHSRWSFRAPDGQRGGDDTAQAVKFLLAAAAGFALNSFWVWLAVHALHLPAWTPVAGMIFATPLATFAINRYWVFT